MVPLDAAIERQKRKEKMNSYRKISQIREQSKIFCAGGDKQTRLQGWRERFVYVHT